MAGILRERLGATLRMAVLCAACVVIALPSALAQSFGDRARRDEVVNMRAEDPAMAAAFRKAQATLDGFLATASNPSPSLRSLALVRITDGPHNFDTSTNRMHGNFTACALLTKEPPEQRKDFMKQYGLRCDG